MLLLVLLILCSYPFLVIWWKKHNFVARDLRRDERVSRVFYIFTFALISAITSLPYLFNNGVFEPNDIKAVFIPLISMLSLHLGISTTCIYLDGNTIVYKNFYRTKRIIICPETEIEVKHTVVFIGKKDEFIKIDGRHFNGTRGFVYRVKIIRDAL